MPLGVLMVRPAPASSSRSSSAVTGVDAAEANVAVARAHAEGAGLAIDYRAGELSALGLGQFDLVTAMEVLEHVADKRAFLAELARHLASGGLMVLSTPNRTPLSRLAMITLAEGTGAIPKGTHDWSRFLKPEELEALLTDAGMKVIDRQGLTFSPARGFVVNEHDALNYLVTAVRA